MTTAASDLSQRYHELAETSRDSAPAAYGDEAATVTWVTPLRKRNGNGSIGRANASLLAAGDCHLIYTTTAHTLMDSGYRYRLPPQALEIRLKDNRWHPALQLVTSAKQQRRDDESIDWGLIVLRLPECNGAAYAPLVSEKVDGRTMALCNGHVEMSCFHIDGDDAVLMREQHCALQSEHRLTEGDPHRIGYMSCDQREGVSGCAPVCRLDGRARALGVFNYGLRASGSTETDQQVGIFRALDGEYYRALEALKESYNLR